MEAAASHPAGDWEVCRHRYRWEHLRDESQALRLRRRGCEDDAENSKATAHRKPRSSSRAMLPAVAHSTGPCVPHIGQAAMWATARVQCECPGFAAGFAVSLLSVYRASLGERLVCLRLWPWALRETPKVATDRDATPRAQQCRCLHLPVALMPSECPNRAFLSCSGPPWTESAAATLTSKGIVRLGKA
ncbi:unnamed protein product [Symbiodinium sp. CCMP2456]|nr:unnamed protein product [Symbiodinium sp. CCMP2456]